MSQPASAGNQTNSSPPPNGTKPGEAPGILRETNHFWKRVTDGLAIDQLMTQFKRDARSGFDLYRRDFDSGTLSHQRRWENWLQVLQEMVWAILGKLTPARRVLLLIALVFLILPSENFRFPGPNGHVIQISTPGFQFWSAVLLFALLMLEVADRVVMKRDLEIARDIQSWLLPAKPPVVPGLTIAFATRPANTVAGDFYDIFPRTTNSAESHFLMAVADVAGKSIPAALLMATFQASLKTLSSTPCPLLDLVEGMNRYACCNSQGGLRFTTAFLAEFNSETRRLSYVNAGHNNPIVQRSSGGVERLDVGGLPLGIQPDAAYGMAEVTLEMGDWLAIFTDGLVEAENVRAEEYGEARLLSSLRAGAAGTTPDVLLQQIIAEVNNFVGATPQHDDITCMLIKAV